MSTQLKHGEITEKIIGCAFKVHSTLGCGFQEVIYQRTLAIEMNLLNLDFARELEVPIIYLNTEIGTRRVDFLVLGKVLVEIKAIDQLTDVHVVQLLNYLKAYKLEVGLLINFGSKSMTFKRMVL